MLGLEVKQSQIKNGGCGLYTLKDIKKGTKITKYTGETLTEKEYHNRYLQSNAKYVFQKGKNVFVNSLCKRSIAAMSNTQKYKKDCNAVFSISRDRSTIFIKTIKNIKSDSEIFTYYGREYKI